MAGDFDLAFTATQGRGKERVDGRLFIAGSGNTYTAISGSRRLRPLPLGPYLASNLRLRGKEEMHLDVQPAENNGGGMCFPAWSVDLEPLFCTERSELRIHPDGNLPGTEGCIGIAQAVDRCYADLKHALESKKQLLLIVNYNNARA
jgi:hypothetical protein